MVMLHHIVTILKSKIHQIIHLKMVIFMSYDLYLKKKRTRSFGYSGE